LGSKLLVGQLQQPVARCAVALFSTTGSTRRQTPQFIRGKTADVKELRGQTIDESDAATENVSALRQAQLKEESDQQGSDEFKLYPDEETFDTLYNGVRFKDLPYVYLKCTRTNTRMAAYMADGTPLHYTTPVLNGFVNSKKKTNVAAQATGLAMGQKLRTLNQKTVRVRVDGFNVGRISSLTGLTQAGINIVSVSDVTFIDWVWTRRAQKAKRE